MTDCAALHIFIIASFAHSRSVMALTSSTFHIEQRTWLCGEGNASDDSMGRDEAKTAVHETGTERERGTGLLAWAPLLTGAINSYGPIHLNYGFALYFLTYQHG